MKKLFLASALVLAFAAFSSEKTVEKATELQPLTAAEMVATEGGKYIYVCDPDSCTLVGELLFCSRCEVVRL